MLDSIYLCNFKCFKNLNIELSNLNIFAGINSMGKSTVIQSILLLRQSYELNLIDSGLQLNGNIINLGTGYDVLCRDGNEDEFSISIKTKDGLFERKYDYEKESDFQKLKYGVNTILELSDINIFSSNFAYISADRIGPKAFYKKSYHHIYNMDQVGYHGELFADHLAEKGYKEHIGCKSVKHHEIDELSLIYQFQAWLSEISPNIKIYPKKHVEAGIVILGYSVGGIENTPLNIGFGISYTAPIILALLKAKKGELVIIENPEAHLHPKGQRILGELISKACAGGVQVIVETHSDHLLNGIRLSVKNKTIDRKLIRLNYFYHDIELDVLTKIEKVVHKKCSPAILDDGSLSDWPEGFFDEWDKAIEILF